MSVDAYEEFAEELTESVISEHPPAATDTEGADLVVAKAILQATEETTEVALRENQEHWRTFFGHCLSLASVDAKELVECWKVLNAEGTGETDFVPNALETLATLSDSTQNVAEAVRKNLARRREKNTISVTASMQTAAMVAGAEAFVAALWELGRASAEVNVGQGQS